MPIYACVHIPEFPAQALLRLRTTPGDGPAAVLEGERPFERLCSRNAHAAALGLELNMSRAEAELFNVPLLRRSREEESAARAALLNSLSLFTPSLQEQSSDTACIFVLDLSGTEKLFGPLDITVARIYDCITHTGLVAKIATASNFHASLCLSRYQRSRILHVSPGDERQALATLPLASLDLLPGHAEAFANWGLKTLDELSQLPEVELIARLGQEGKRLRQLARGEYPHHFQPIEEPTRFEEYLEFDAPVEILDSLLFALNPMLGQLLYRVRSHALAFSSLTLHASLEGGSEYTRTVRPALPTEDRAMLLKLLQLDTEAHPPAAGVLTLRLTGEIGPTSKVQSGLFSPQLPEPMRLEVTLARIAAIVGEGRVGKAVLGDSHAADAFSVHKFTVAVAISKSAQKKSAVRKPSVEDETGQRSSPALRRFRPPLTVLVEFRAQRISALWHNSVLYQVQRLYGPWRASGTWWNDQLWAVERWDFAARSEDGQLLVGVVLHDRFHRVWQLEGLYD